MKPLAQINRTLLIHTALASGIIALSPGVAMAQTMPTGPTVVSGSATVDFADNVGNNNIDTVTVDLNGASAVINWATFNLINGNNQNKATANFISTGPDGGKAVSVLNRVATTGGDTTINGRLDTSNGGSNNITFWLVNQNGITWGSNATYNGGSLLLSTLPITSPANFTGTGAAVFEGSSSEAISLDGVLKPTGDLIVIARGVTFTANADVAPTNRLSVVAANKVSFGDINSPLNFTIDTGTDLAVGGGVTVVGGAKVGGSSLTIATVSKGTAVNNLLQIQDQSTLTATGANGVITLATKSAGGVTITGNGDGIVFGDSPTPTNQRAQIVTSQSDGTVNLAAAGDLTINGEFTLNTPTGATFNAQGSTIAINTGAISAGTQSYTGATTLNADTTLTGNATFTTTVDSKDGGQFLNVSGNAKFDGAVGGTQALSSLTVGGTTAINGGSVTTGGNQTYTGAVTLGAGAVLTANAGAGAISFGSSIDGASTLKLAGNAKLDGAVGATTKLTSLEVTGTTAINGGQVQTTGTQLYSGDVALGANTTLTASSAKFSGLIDSADATARSLTITGGAQFDGAVGSNNILSALSTNTVSGTTAINTATVKTSGNQTYNGDTTFSVDDTNLTGSNVKFGAKLDTAGGNGNLTVTGNGQFVGAVGSGTALNALTVTGTAAIDGPSITTTGNQTYSAAATIGSGATLDAGAGAIAFNGTVNGPGSLTVKSITTFDKAVGATAALASFTANADVSIKGGSFRTSGDQTYSAGKALNLVGGKVNLLVTNNANAVKLQGAVTNDLTTSLTITGNAEITPSLGGTLPLLDVSVTGNTDFIGAGGHAVTTIRSQAYGGSVTFGAGGLTLTSDGGVGESIAVGTKSSASLVNSTGNLTIRATLPADVIDVLVGNVDVGQLKITNAASITASGNIKTVADITLDSVGAISVKGLNSTTGSVLINQSTLTPSTVAINGTVSTANAYKVKASTLTLSGTQTAPGDIELTATTGAITSATPALLTSTGGHVYLNAQDPTGSISLASGSLLKASSDVGLFAGSKNITVGDVTANRIGQIDSTTLAFTDGIVAGSLNNFTTGMLKVGTAINFDVTGALNIGGTTTTGNVTLKGASVGYGTSGVTSTAQKVDVTATGGSITLNGTIDSTAGGPWAQAYHGAVTVGKAGTDLVTLKASTATFDSTVDGPGGLKVAGDAQFNGTIGGTTRLNSLEVTGAANISASPTIKTVGDQTFGKSVVLTSATTFDSTSGLVDFQGTVDSDATARDLTVTSNARFRGAVGSTSAINNLKVVGNAQIDGGAITTIGNLTIGGNTTLTADTKMVASGLISLAKVDSDAALTPRALTLNGNTSISGLVGDTAALNSLTITAPATIAATQAISTVGDITMVAPTSISLAGLKTSSGNILINQLGIPGTVQIDGAVSSGGTYVVDGLTVKLGGGLHKAAGTVDIQTSVGDISNLSPVTLQSSGGNVTVNSGNNIALGSTAISAAGNTALLAGLTKNITVSSLNSATVSTSAGLGNFSIGQFTLSGGGFNLTTSGSITAGTASSVSSANFVSFTSPAITLNGTINTTSGTQTYNGATTLAGNTALSATTVTFKSNLNGAGGLAITGSGVFEGNIGNTTPLAYLTISKDASLGGVVNIDGLFQIDGSILLIKDTTFTSGSGNLVFNNAIDSGTGGPWALTLNTSQSAILNKAIGSISALKSLTVNGNTTLADGNVSTVNNQTYNGAVTLAANAKLSSTAGTVNFASTVDGANSLTVTGNAAFADVVGGKTSLSSIQVTGSTAIDTSAITTTGNQVYNGTATLTKDAILTVGSGSAIVFNSSLNGAANTLQLAGNATLGGATSLKSLQADGTTNINGASVVTTSLQTYKGAVNLAGPTTALTGSAVDFQGTLNGPSALTITGAATFGQAVGSGTSLTSLAVSGASAINGGAVTTTGTQAYNGPVTLGAATTLTGSQVTFGSSLNSASSTLRALTISGNGTFNGAIGATNALDSLLVTGNAAFNSGVTSVAVDKTLGVNGTTAISTTGVIGAAAQTYTGAVTLAANTTLSGNATFGSTINGTSAGAQSLTIQGTAGNATFGGNVGATTALSALTVGGTANINGASVVTTGLQTYKGAVNLAGPATALTGSAVDFQGTVNGPSALTITGAATFGQAVGSGTSLTSLAVSGASAINGGAVTTTGTQAYNGPVTLGAATTLTGSQVTFGSSLNSASSTLRALTISGNGTFNGAIGATNALDSLLVTGNAAFNSGVTSVAVDKTLGVNGTTAISTTGVIGAAAQTYTGAVTLAANTTLSGNATFGSTINGTSAGAQSLTIQGAAGNATFGGNVGATTALSALTVGGTANINGASVVTTGLQTYNGAVNLAGPATALTGSAVDFQGTVNGPSALTITGAATFGQAVGLGTSLTSLAVSGASAINGGAVTTTGTQAYNGPVTLGADTSLNGSAIAFGSTLNSTGTARNLTTTGNTTFGGAVGALAGGALKNLTVNGSVALNGPSVITTLDQTYKGAATLGSDVNLSSGGGTVSFASTINGAQALNVSGNASFAGAIGGTAAPTALSVTAPGAINAAAAINVAGPVSLNGATVSVSGPLSTTGAGGNVAITSTGATTLNALNASGTFVANADSLVVTNTAKSAGAMQITVAKSAQLGGVDALGNASIKAGTINVAGAANSGAAMDLNATGAIDVGSLKAGTTATANGASIKIAGQAQSGAAMNLTATGTTIDVGSIAAGGDVSTNSKTKTTLGVVTATGKSVTLTAADADLNGTVSASTVKIVNSAAAGNPFRLGNAGGTGGFALSQTELNGIAAGTLILDAGTGTGATRQDVLIGNLSLTNSALQNLTIQTLQRLDLTGNLIWTGGSSRTLILGGSSTANDKATVLRVAANADGTGGRIDVGSGAVELRSANIGIGQDGGFLTPLGLAPGGTPSTQTATDYVSSAASSLYSSIIGGGTTYLPSGQNLITAGKLTIKYSNFALIQNTALGGLNDGVNLGAAGSTVPALVISGPNPPDAGPFAVFGKINDLIGVQAAVQPSGYSVIAVSRPTARINGCLVGSAAGCLASSALFTGLQLVTPSRTTIIFANSDFEIPFDPLIATNNDSLFGDVGTFGLEDLAVPAADCTGANAANCKSTNGAKK